MALLLLATVAAASASAQSVDAKSPASDKAEAGPNEAAAAPDAAAGEESSAAEDATADAVAANNPTMSVSNSALSGGAILSVTQNIGQGTFVPKPRWNPYVMTQLDMAFFVNLYGVVLSASESVTGEWTQPDSYGGSRLGLLGDPRFAAQYNLALPFGFVYQPRVGFRLPVTRLSRAQGIVGSAFVGSSLIWQPLTGLLMRTGATVQGNAAVPALRAFGGAAKDDTVLFRSSDRIAVGSCLARTGETIAQACGTIPSMGQAVVSTGLSYTLWGFTTSASMAALGLVSGYFGPQDEYTSPNAYAGFFPRVFTLGSLSAGYRFFSWFALNAGVSSFQPWSMAGNNIPRLPFWDFVSPANNFSTVFLSATFNI